MTNTNSLTTPRRRWFQFRLRTLIVVMAALAVLLTLANRPFQEWRRRERARAQRKELLGLGDFPGDIPLRRAIPQEVPIR